MHFYALAVVPGDGDVDRLVAETLAPYDYRREVEPHTAEDGTAHWYNPDGLWDWFQIGGRWTGVLSGYRPQEDPSLMPGRGGGLSRLTLAGDRRAGESDRRVVRSWIESPGVTHDRSAITGRALVCPLAGTARLSGVGGDHAACAAPVRRG